MRHQIYTELLEGAQYRCNQYTLSACRMCRREHMIRNSVQELPCKCTQLLLLQIESNQGAAILEDILQESSPSHCGLRSFKRAKVPAHLLLAGVGAAGRACLSSPRSCWVMCCCCWAMWRRWLTGCRPWLCSHCRHRLQGCSDLQKVLTAFRSLDP